MKAADAFTLLQARLPFVLEHMTEKQVQQMQRVLDAAVVNPDVEKEAADLYRRSITAQSGSLSNRDPRMVRRGDRAMESSIPIREADKRIRLDFNDLLTPEALKATTDNPDEAAYLQAVKNTLAAKGVWLRFAPKLVRDPDDPSRHILDERTWEVWLSLGPDGDAIPTESGRLTRDSLLNTTVLGAGYYRRVDKGPVQSALDKEIRRLQSEIEIGLTEHQRQAKIRRDAFVGVAEASDLLGGADFPSQSIWDQPHKFVLRAMQLNVGGNVKRSPAYLVTAAILTRNAAWLLAQYIEDTSTGAERAVTVLKVARTAGQVAEVGLGVMGGVGLVRGVVSGGAALAGEAGAVGADAAASSVDAAAERTLGRYAAKNKMTADELAKVGLRGEAGSVQAAAPLDAAEERYVNQYIAENGGSVKLEKPPGYGRSVGGNIKGGHSSGTGEGFHKLH
ncbi:MAG: hypothetical protein M3R62_15550 [Acidobacteriota bacterium]|nr:hypothetical protein [Acidobacteriota bacterium]